MKLPVGKLKPVIPNRLVFLLMFSLFFWIFEFILGKNNLQLSQAVFNLWAGTFGGAVSHVLIAKLFGPLLFGRGFCGWACWNAGLFDLLPVKKRKPKVSNRCLSLKYLVMIIVLVLPIPFIAAGIDLQKPDAQFKWIIVENVVIYVLGTVMAFWLGDKRAFCKYVCPAGALMTYNSVHSVLKVEKNHLRCFKCKRCEEACPMDVPILQYISANKRVSHPECILCGECVKACPNKCLTIGIGTKPDTAPELGRSF